ncbi:MAG: type IV pilus assembly protein PilX [Methylophagaceae bacterium]|jgi:type IV pilus assembly protein PilX
MHYSSVISKQSGVVLVISLIMLLLLTMIGITGMQVTGLEEKMAGNMKNSNTAFQAAETALRDRELWLQTNKPSEDDINATSLWHLNATDSDTTDATPWWQEKDAAWWPANGIISASVPAGVKTAPYSIVEYKYFKLDVLNIGTTTIPSGQHFYQITSRGTGGNDQAQILLQSITAWGNN